MKPTYEELEAKVKELDETVAILQRMNENTAKMSVGAFKNDLASALKSLVEDMALPEVKGDAVIMEALMEDMLDVLRFKGVLPT